MKFVLRILMPLLFSSSLWAQGSTKDPMTSAEPDLARMRSKGVLTPDFAQQIEFTEEAWRDSNGKTWKFQVIKSLGGSRPVFFLPHDNENVAFETAFRFLKNHGRGTMVFLACGEDRMCWGTDPNRYFCNSSFNSKVFSYFSGASTAIALHTNQDKCEQNGGSGHISAKFPYSGATGAYRGGDEDDLYVHIGRLPKQGRNLRFSQNAASRNYNELYENINGRNDCSMSFAASHRGYFYFNVETQERFGSGAYQTQLRMLESALSWVYIQEKGDLHENDLGPDSLQ